MIRLLGRCCLVEPCLTLRGRDRPEKPFPSRSLLAEPPDAGENSPAHEPVFGGNKNPDGAVFISVDRRTGMPGGDTRGDGRRARFEREVLPHLDAAYNLARWLLRDGEEAADAVQEACLRAYKYFDGFHGDNAKPWLLKIVRNSCYGLSKGRPRTESMSPDEEGRLDPAHEKALEAAGHGTPTPEALLIAKADRRMLQDGLATLPADYREVLVLREIEELSYKEISEIAEIPIGTVMSRLARGRALLQKRLATHHVEES
jgi:RNA polymerase sigma factor (sigma-70 family)